MHNLFRPMAVKHLHRRERETQRDTGKEKRVEQSAIKKSAEKKKKQTHRKQVTNVVENN